MFIAKRHPMMKTMLRAESGVFGTYTLAVVAVVCSVISAAVFLDPSVSTESAVAAAFGDAGPPFADAAPQRAPGTEQSAATPPAATADWEVGINGLDLPPDQPTLPEDQPIYDEAAAVLIYTR